ncbi:MAG: ATP-binding protein [Deltaproteobacteria bacterium]|nr:ATP-binding protein [Deltaproteobacteria bacterium]
MDFFGRNKELAYLKEAYLSNKTEFIPIYGRRRVGKSELIRQFCSDKPHVYLMGKQALAELQITEFMNEGARCFKQPLLRETQTRDWKKALQLLIDHKKEGKKLIIVFDEFQWLVAASPELPSILQELLDTEWKKRRDIFLILCGSYLGFMEKEVLGEKSPLFGRRSGQIFLKPFPYYEAALFHPRWSVVDKAKAYFICGGVPYYLLFFKDHSSIEKNIINHILSEFAPLFREPDFLLREELRELQKYYSILMSLALGSQTLPQLAQQSGVGDKKLSYYLQTLLEIGYVRRKFPLSHKKTTKNEVRFILEDPLLRFWFFFVYPQQSYLAQVSPEQAYLAVLKPRLESYFGVCFENLCREALTCLSAKSSLGSFQVGEYWDKNVQIDVVGLYEKEKIILGECKWGKVKSSTALKAELEAKIACFPNPKGLTIRKALFTQKEITKKEGDVEYYSLEKIYNLMPSKFC